ncbi:hypothetical protein [Vannielia sp.]|uniref:hypothetical protein n=1 Tax=Vannielia sp. TaxID=2813045 RepID=UPI002610FECD|nr:hypothetical protein [Vannielia sp.]MDF1871200.1 hypothetical protein [Vannielia sp.]
MTAQRVRYQRLARAMAIVGLAAWAIGTLGSVLGQLNPDLFHRFGALGVAASVLFFSDRMLQVELARQRSVERMLHEFGVELEVMRSGTEPTDIPSEGYVVDFLTEERNFDALHQRADLNSTFNVALLTVATLQWGFGDMFLRWLNGGVTL